MGATLQIDTDGVKGVAHELNRIVDALRDAQRAGDRTPPAAGRDEVSTTVTRTLTAMDSAETRAAADVWADLRDLARSVREHAGAVEAAELQYADRLTARA